MLTKQQIDAAVDAFAAEPDILPGATLRDQIAAAIVAAERAAWLPIAEAPIDGRKIIARSPMCRPYVCWRDDGGWVDAINYDGTERYRDPTHYRPLPEGPRE